MTLVVPVGRGKNYSVLGLPPRGLASLYVVNEYWVFLKRTQLYEPLSPNGKLEKKNVWVKSQSNTVLL